MMTPPMLYFGMGLVVGAVMMGLAVFIAAHIQELLTRESDPGLVMGLVAVVAVALFSLAVKQGYLDGTCIVKAVPLGKNPPYCWP